MSTDIHTGPNDDVSPRTKCRDVRPSLVDVNIPAHASAKQGYSSCSCVLDVSLVVVVVMVGQKSGKI